MSTSVAIDSISDRILHDLPHRLSRRRLEHVFGVVSTAEALAERFGVDRDRVRLAAAAHDMDRELSPGRALAYAADRGLPLDRQERLQPVLIHGVVSADRLRREYGVGDEELLTAVRHHTLGSPDFGPVGLVLYIADFCEPRRRHVSEEDRRRILGRTDLHEMVRDIIAMSRRRFGTTAPSTEALFSRVSGRVDIHGGSRP